MPRGVLRGAASGLRGVTAGRAGICASEFLPQPLDLARNTHRAPGLGVAATPASAASLASVSAPSVDSPFASGGLQSSLAARDQRIALLEYRLRCADEDARALRAQLDDALIALAPAGAGAAGAGAGAKSGAAAAGAAAVATSTALQIGGGGGSGGDEDGRPIAERERRTINALVRRYLLARGYKMAAVAFAEETLAAHALGAATGVPATRATVKTVVWPGSG